MLAIMTPISQAKAYAWNEYIRGVRQLDFPKEEIVWLFVVQEQGLGGLPRQIEELKRRVGDEYHAMESVYHAPEIDARLFDPRYSDQLTWKERAWIAARLRAVGFDFIAQEYPEATHTLSLGCDVLLNQPDTLTRMLAPPVALISGVILARVRGFPLVLHYYPETKRWDWWTDYPKDGRFTADWSGLDIALMTRELLAKVSLWDFDVEEYGVGEDGWFCLKAKEAAEAATWIDPGVTPYHLHQGDVCLWAGGEAPRYGIRLVCPNCGRDNGPTNKNYVECTVRCPACGQFYPADPWYLERERCAMAYQITGMG